jgi:hypothetical protein
VRQRALLLHWPFPFLVAILAGIAGLVGVGSAWATTATAPVAACATTEPAASTTPFSAYGSASYAYAYDARALLASPDAAATNARGVTPAEPAAASWVSPVSVARNVVAANTAGGGSRSVVTSTDVVTSPSAMEGLTASQVDDLARNAGYEVLPGKVGAANPATRYYAPGTNGSVGFRILPQGVAGQSGVNAGPYLRFFGGPNAGQRISLGAS